MAVRRITGPGVLIGVVATLIVLAAAGLIIVYSGGYDVAASSGHSALGRWALTTTMHNSVKSRAAEIAEPRFNPAMIAAGAGEYKAMCQHCHGGPGVRAEEWSQGMLPNPPRLTVHAADWRPREVFWILQHGIQMSGMPSFRDHDDATLWNIAAFVKALPGMSSEQYAAYPSGEEHGGASGGEHAGPADAGKGHAEEGGHHHHHH